MKKIVFSLAVLFFFAGCAMLKPPHTVELTPQLSEVRYDNFAILPFADKRPAVRDNFDFDVSEVVTDAFESAFKKARYTIASRNDIESALAKMDFSYTGHIDTAQMKQVGELTHSDILILGRVRDFQKARFERVKGKMKAVSCTTLSFAVKAVHIDSGDVLWRGAITRSAGLKGDMFSPCDGNAIGFAERTSKALVKNILAKTDSALNTKDGEYDMFPSLD